MVRIYKPNLIENLDTYTDQYLLNGVQVGYSTDDARSVTPVQMLPIGYNKSFVSGTVFMNYEGDVDTYFQTFKIQHKFIVIPFYFDGGE